MAALPEEKILGDLLADRAGAAQARDRPAPLLGALDHLPVVDPRFLDRVQVEAMMGSEVLVFRRHHRQRQAGCHPVQVAPVVGHAEAEIAAPPGLQHPGRHEGTERRVDEAEHRDLKHARSREQERQGEQPAEPAAYAAGGGEWMGHLW